MNSVEFSARYPQQVENTGPYASLLAPADKWSAVFGQIIHQRLRNQTLPQSLFANLAPQYQDWVTGDQPNSLPDILATLTASDTDDKDINTARMRLAFHHLMPHTLPLWQPWTGQGWENDTHREEAHQIALDALSLSAMTMAKLRQQLVGQEDNQYFVEPRNQGRFNLYNGFLTKFDATFIATCLSMRRRQQLLAVAPVQFSHSPNKALNLDLVFFDGVRQAIGARTVTTVLPPEKQPRSPTVVLSSKKDFKQTLRHPAANRKERSLSWSGGLCAQHLLSRPFNDVCTNLSHIGKQVTEPEIAANKKTAAVLLRGATTATLREALGVIDNKVHTDIQPQSV